MASLRRNRTMPTDGAIAKFLYTILKQLDLKSIDWNEVAGSLDITNGHAARMRFSRFKQQMEGIQPQVRKPKSSTQQPQQQSRKKKPNQNPKPSAAAKSEPHPNPGVVKPENAGDHGEGGEEMQGVEASTIKTSPVVKPEFREGEGEQRLHLIPSAPLEGYAAGMEDFKGPGVGEQTFGGFGDVMMGFEGGNGVKQEVFFKEEPVVKVEPYWE